MATLNINSDNVIELRSLKDIISDTVITTATVTVTLTQDGTEVVGETWPLSMPHVANGLYRAILPNELVLNDSLSYVATIVADNGAGQHREWSVPYVVVSEA